jgi:co-chaperonin GroES (HSP10)
MLNGFLLVEPVEKRAGILELSDDENMGKIVFVVESDKLMEFSIGDRLLITRYYCAPVKDGEKIYHIVKDEDVVAIL